MREAGVNMVGIGYTIYLGSEYESTMMAEAGELIAQGPRQRPAGRAVDLPPRQGRQRPRRIRRSSRARRAWPCASAPTS